MASTSPKRKAPDTGQTLVTVVRKQPVKKLRHSSEGLMASDDTFATYSKLLHLIAPGSYPEPDTWILALDRWTQRQRQQNPAAPSWQNLYSAFVEQRAAFSKWWAVHRASRNNGRPGTMSEKCPLGLPFLGIILARDPSTETRVTRNRLEWKALGQDNAWYALDPTQDCRPTPTTPTTTGNTINETVSVSAWLERSVIPAYRMAAMKRIMNKYGRWVTDRVNWPPIARTQLMTDWERLSWLDYEALLRLEPTTNFDVWSWITVGWLRSWLYPSLDVSQAVSSDQAAGAYRFLHSLSDTLQRQSVGHNVSAPARNRMAGVNAILDAYRSPVLFLPFACMPVSQPPTTDPSSSFTCTRDGTDGDQTERLIEAFSRVEISPPEILTPLSSTPGMCPRCVGIILPIMPLVTSGGRRYWLVHMTSLQVSGSLEMQQAVRDFYRRPIDATMRRFLDERLLGEHDTARARIIGAQTVRDLGMRGTEFAGFVRQAFFVPILRPPYEPRALFDDILLPVEIWNPFISESSSTVSLASQMDMEDLINRNLPGAEELRKDALIRSVLSSLDVQALSDSIGPTQTVSRLQGHFSSIRDYSSVLHVMEPVRFSIPQGFYEQWVVFVRQVVVPIWNGVGRDPLQWTVWLHRYLLRRLGKTYERDSYLEGFLALDADTLTCSCFCGSVLMALASDALGFYGRLTMNWLMSQHIFFGTETLGWETTMPDLCELSWEPVAKVFDRMNSLPIDTSFSFVAQPIRSLTVLLHHVVTQWMNDRIAYRLGPGPSDAVPVVMPDLPIDRRVIEWWRDRQPIVVSEQPPRLRWLDAYMLIVLDLLKGSVPTSFPATERFLETSAVEAPLELSINFAQLNLQAWTLVSSYVPVGSALRASIVRSILQGDASLQRLREQWPAKWTVATDQGLVSRYEEWRQRVRTSYGA